MSANLSPPPKLLLGESGRKLRQKEKINVFGDNSSLGVPKLYAVAPWGAMGKEMEHGAMKAVKELFIALCQTGTGSGGCVPASPCLLSMAPDGGTC